MNCMWPAAWIQLRLSYSQPKIYNKLKMEKIYHILSDAYTQKPRCGLLNSLEDFPRAALMD